MSRREISESRAAKLALLQQLSARRAERSVRDGGVSARGRHIIGLSDSSDDDSSDHQDNQNASDSSASSDTASSDRETGAPVRLDRIWQGDNSVQREQRGGTGVESHGEARSTRQCHFTFHGKEAKEAKEAEERRTGLDITEHLLGALRLSEGNDPCSSRIQQDLQSSCEKTNTPPSVELRQFHLPDHLETKLYDYQKKGIQWMFGLWKVGAGGILADDMGLGKTLQTSCFLSGILINSLSKKALVVAPTTLLATWHKELALCGLQNRTYEYSGSSLARQKALDGVAENGGVLLASYGMILHNAPALKCHPQHDADEGPFWDVIVMDEGHKLKNPKMQLRRSIDMLPARQRLILSGTPIQNNLMEMHTLFDLVCPGLLGNARYFKDHFERRITAGTDKHATIGERERGAAAAAELRQLVAPYMLRREKKDVLPPNSKKGTEQEGGMNSFISMPMKNDLVVWLRLNQRQRALYQAFLNSDAVRAALNRTMSPLASLTVLKKLCDHPALLSENAQEGVLSGISSGGGQADGVQLWEDLSTCVNDSLLHILQLSSTSSNNLQASCKTAFVLDLLKILIPAGHRTLIFSQSCKMLDILEVAVQAENWPSCRIDGSVEAEERQARVNVFQRDATIPVFLLTSQVGGLGLTLTGADRVIIVDPAWNPSVDSQSVDRAYRIGQTKNVVVYRLISCGTVEDKIYRKQVFKGGLSRTGTQSGEQFRYFTASELRDLYRLDPSECYQSSTLLHLHKLHAHQRQSTAELDAHLQHVQSLEGVAGVSDHDLLYSVKAAEGPEPAGAVAVPSNPSPTKSVVRASQPSRGYRTGGGGGGGGIKGNMSWNGQTSDITEAFSRVLSLSEGNKEDSRSRELARLKSLLQKQESLLGDGALAASLVDGGAKIRAKILSLKQEIAILEGEHDVQCERRNEDKHEHESSEQAPARDGEHQTLSDMKKNLYIAAKKLEKMFQNGEGEGSQKEVIEELRKEVQELATRYDALKSDLRTPHHSAAHNQ